MNIPDVLDLWEKEAQQNIEEAIGDERDGRILALIELIRKKDLKIKQADEIQCYACSRDDKYEDCICLEIPEMKSRLLNEALALTETLK